LAIAEEEQLLVFVANLERPNAQVGRGVDELVDVASVIRRVHDYEGAVLVEDIHNLVIPGVLQGYAALVARDLELEGPVAALRPMRAGEPERVGDVELPARRRRWWEWLAERAVAWLGRAGQRPEQDTRASLRYKLRLRRKGKRYVVREQS
jgi:hypothetical protein